MSRHGGAGPRSMELLGVLVTGALGVQGGWHLVFLHGL
jgi:hypothetical protein